MCIKEKEYYTAEDYLANPDLFVPCWKDEWNPPVELLDFEKKWEAFFTPNGRLMSMAHRGDSNIYYPEDSLEGIMSCIMAGVDMLELDVRLTKDGVMVSRHDATLTRTTNVQELRAAGVEDLPESDNVCDWTYEQLMRLRLCKVSGEEKILTNYVIPTLDDILKICANRIFVFLDIKERDKIDWDRDVYPMIKKYNAQRSILTFTISCSMPMDEVSERLSVMEKDSGYKTPFQIGIGPANIEEKLQIVKEYQLPLALRGFDYKPEYDEALASYFGKYRIHINGIWAPYNHLEDWKKFHETGYNVIQINDFMALLKYIAEMYF